MAINRISNNIIIPLQQYSFLLGDDAGSEYDTNGNDFLCIK